MDRRRSESGSAFRKRTLPELIEMKRHRERIAMITAYDAPSARLAEAAGIDMILVGDSAAMTVLGHASTLPITIEEMLMLTRAVTRGARDTIVVADLPFGSFQVSDEAAVANAVRFIKDGGADAVKIEGGGRNIDRAGAIMDAGIPVMGHVGLTPQSATLLGGYKAQGRTAAAAQALLRDARALERAGCFAVVLEALPPPVAARITDGLAVPTIGIGAGSACDGQVLVWHDVMGLSPAPLPRFVKTYADLAGPILEALERYITEVRAGSFPDARHTYSMPEGEREVFESGNGPGDARKAKIPD